MATSTIDGFGRPPLELAYKILGLLDPISTCNFSQTNHWWRELCGGNELWRSFCKARFQLNDITSNGFKKLVWTYPDVMASWKDWYAFRSQFRREVAGSINIEVQEILIDTGDKIKKVPAKNITANYVCLSQPPQSSYGSRNASFFFDEYHTLIQCEFYENKSWFYNRHCLGRVTMPVFHCKQHKSQVWLELEDTEDRDDTSSNADSEAPVLSDDDRDYMKSSDHFGPHVTITERAHFQDYPSYKDDSSYQDGTESYNNSIHDKSFDLTSDPSESDNESRTGRSITPRNGHKSRSLPTSPKRGRKDSVKSSSSLNGTSQQSSAINLHHSSTIPSSSSAYSLSRPSSPPNSPPNHPGRHIEAASSSSTSKRKSGEIRLIKEVHPGSASDSFLWFLSTSPLVAADSVSLGGRKRATKRVLLTLTLTPVAWSVQDFEMLASISHGAFNSPNELLLVKDKDTNTPWFMKIVPTVSNESSVRLEGSKESVAYSTSLSWQLPPHPFVVEFYTTFQTDTKLYLLMEWLGGGELFSVLRRTRHGRFDEDIVRFYTAELLLGMEHMHQHKIIYRDLKPENLLLSAEGHLKITQRTPPESLWDGPRQGFTILTAHSLPEYLAPEILKGQPYTNKADSWSVGTILYHMLAGQPPFHHPNVQSLFSSIINDEVMYPPYMSPTVISLLKGLLNRDVKKRWTIKYARNHEFFESDWVRLTRQEVPPPLKPFRRQDLDFSGSKKQAVALTEAAPSQEPPPSAIRHMSL